MTTRSQDRNSLNGDSELPSQNSVDSPTGRPKRAAATAPAGSPNGGPTRQRTSRTARKDATDDVAVPSSQVESDKNARKLVFRPHGSDGEYTTPVEGARASGVRNMESDETHVVKETQLLEVGGTSAVGDSFGEPPLSQMQISSPFPFVSYEGPQQVMESTQDLDVQNMTASEDSTPSRRRREGTLDKNLVSELECSNQDAQGTAVEAVARKPASPGTHNSKNGANGNIQPMANGISTAKPKHFRFPSEEPVKAPYVSPIAVQND